MELEEVEKHEKKVMDMFKTDPQNSTSHFILGAYYEKKGLLEDAIEEFKIISNRNIYSPIPHEILGKLYNNIAFKDRAILELQKALQLSQQR